MIAAVPTTIWFCGVYTRLAVRDNFLSKDLAHSLRSTFDSRFSEARQTPSERFVWDFWFVKDQYNLVRTPAELFFDGEGYDGLCDALTDFGLTNLGCDSITPPWLSYYVDGCSQSLHTDAWHGPFAYVLSLTRWRERTFEGGETFLLADHVLDYWRHFQPGRAAEASTMMELVEPEFNRLTVFDPRVPHGVREVSGTRDPLESRLVLHGWFTPMEHPTIAGALGDEAALQAGATEVLNTAIAGISSDLTVGNLARMIGSLSVRVDVDGSGKVKAASVLGSTLVVDPRELAGDADAGNVLRQHVIDYLTAAFQDCRFPPAGAESSIYVPFVFE